jgi:endonuclease III
MTKKPAKAAPSRRRTEVGRRVDARARAKAARTFDVLRAAYPDVECALRYESPFQLLVAVILSAQCTDARVNLVTPALFAELPTPKALADAPRERVEELVRTTGFFRNKAKNIQGAARRLVEAFGGEVPRGMDELLSLPGVARKTANVVRGECYGLADGVVVDTHIFRVAKRLGWSSGKTAEHVERDLMALFPKERWLDVGDVLIWHGRRICHARKPDCPSCSVKSLCPSSWA